MITELDKVLLPSYFFYTYNDRLLLTEGSRKWMILANMLFQTMTSPEGISTNIARNANVGDVMQFNMIHDEDHLSFLATLCAYSCSCFVYHILTESHHWLHLPVKLFKIKWAVEGYGGLSCRTCAHFILRLLCWGLVFWRGMDGLGFVLSPRWRTERSFLWRPLLSIFLCLKTFESQLSCHSKESVEILLVNIGSYL